MRAVLLFLLFLGAWAVPSAKVQQLQKALTKAMKKSNGVPVIDVDADFYKSLVLKSPKPYHLFIFLGAKEEVCRYCPPFKNLFNHIATSFYHADQHVPQKGKEPVFFLHVDIMNNQEVAEVHGLKGLPTIVHVHSSKGLQKKKNGKLMFKDRDVFALRKLETPPEEMLDWANNQVGGREVPLYYTPIEKLYRALFVVGCLSALAVVGVAGIIACRRFNGLVCLIALIIQYVSTSGLFYNILQGMQWAGVDEKGGVQYIMPGTRGQYLAEGLFMSGCTVLTGILLLASARLPFNGKLRSLLGDGMQTIIQIGMMLLSCATMWAVFAGYKNKTGWYQEPAFLPPPWYKTGPVGVDQGNSF